MIALKTQKPLSSTNIFPLPQTGFVSRSRVPIVLPISSNSLLWSCVGQYFPSCSSTALMISESAHPASWYSLPNGHGFHGTNIKPWASVFVDPLAHTLIDAVDPTQYKIVGHIPVPTIQHIMYFPELVTELWWFPVHVC